MTGAAGCGALFDLPGSSAPFESRATLSPAERLRQVIRTVHDGSTEVFIVGRPFRAWPGRAERLTRQQSKSKRGDSPPEIGPISGPSI
jgi:hypothetical protein